MLTLVVVPQKRKGSRRKRDEAGKRDSFSRLTDEEKSDLVVQAIESIQAEIDQVMPNLLR